MFTDAINTKSVSRLDRAIPVEVAPAARDEMLLSIKAVFWIATGDDGFFAFLDFATPCIRGGLLNGAHRQSRFKSGGEPVDHDGRKQEHQHNRNQNHRLHGTRNEFEAESRCAARVINRLF